MNTDDIPAAVDAMQRELELMIAGMSEDGARIPGPPTDPGPPLEPGPPDDE